MNCDNMVSRFQFDIHIAFSISAKTDREISTDELQKWISNSTLISTLIDVVYRSVFGMHSTVENLHRINTSFFFDWFRIEIVDHQFLYVSVSIGATLRLYLTFHRYSFSIRIYQSNIEINGNFYLRGIFIIVFFIYSFIQRSTRR